MARCIRLLLSICLLLAAAHVRALPVTGLYGHEVAVANQSEGERNRAFRQALEAVFVKITGERRWLENPSLLSALSEAQRFVEAIQYRTQTLEVVPGVATSPGTAAEPGAPVRTQQEYLEVSFSRPLIDGLLANTAIPVWDSNRPSVLVWMALQNDAGERSLLSAESNPEIVAIMRGFASQRGLPVIFPLLDFEDRRALTADMIWSLDEPAIRRASNRYGADSVLAGRLHLGASGDLVGLWQFIFRDTVEVFDSFETDLEAYITDPLDRITGQLARHFAVVASLDGRQRVRLRVEGVGNLASYADLVGYLQSLVLVQAVNLAQLDGRVIEIDLTLQGSREQLHDLLALDRNLLPMDERTGEIETVLSYQWIR